MAQVAKALKKDLENTTVSNPVEAVVSCDLQLLESMKSMLMQTPDDLRRDIISRMHVDDSKVILTWLDEACGGYSYHLCKSN